MNLKSNTKFLIALLSPAIVLIGFVVIYPLLQAFYLSFTDYSLLKMDLKWQGLLNFFEIFKDKCFWEVVFNTAVISFSAVIFQVIFGLIMALLLDQKIKGRNLFRGIVLINWVIPLVVVSLLWMWIFDSEYGIFNYLLTSIGVISEYAVWLGRPFLAKLAIIITEIWRGVPFMMVMFLAGLQTIPRHIVEAAEMDGVTSFSKFWNITLPYITPIGMIASLLSVVRLFQEFDIIYIMTGGGPLFSTTTLSIHVYKTAFNTMEMGRASAMGIIWLLFLSFFALLYSKLLNQQEF